MTPALSIIIPAKNEAAHIVATLQPLQALRRANCEVILVDGGSEDETAALADPYVDRVIVSLPGRATQMNRGAEAASADHLLFLHADTQLPPSVVPLLGAAFDRQPKCWGRFNVRLSGDAWVFRVIESMMNWRSCITGMATGDQAIFVERELFYSIGGFPEVLLMEDILISKSLKKVCHPLCIKERVVTSSRRWEQRGVVKTVLLMWWCRFAFFMGASPERVARWYR